MKIERLTEKQGNHYCMKDAFKIFNVIQKLGQLEDEAEEYGIDTHVMIELAKSQIKTVSDNCKQEHIIDDMAKFIDYGRDINEELCVSKLDDKCTCKNCHKCIKDWFSKKYE